MLASEKVTGSHLIGMALKLEDVRNIFTIAGDHILHAMDVLNDMDFHFVDTRHEQAAVHMADAWGKITGQPGVCMYTTPGFANAIPGLANALHNESPVISISGSAPSTELGRGAMQEIDQVSMAAPVTKGSWLVTDARQIPYYLIRAMRTAFAGRRGPVHLTIPTDVQEQEVSLDEINFWRPGQYRSKGHTMPNPDLVEQAIHLLRRAQRPVVVAGGPAAYAPGTGLQEFIETLHIPLFTEDMARGLVPDAHPYCFGFFERGLNRAARLISDADVIVLLGRKQDYTIRFARPPVVASSAHIIQIDPDPEQIARNRAVSVAMACDIESALSLLIKEASKYTWKPLPWLDRLRAELATQNSFLESLAVAETPMHPMFVHKTLSRFLRPDDFLVFDGGNFPAFARVVHPASLPGRWHYLPPLGMLGSSIPTGLAAKLAHPESRVVVMTGDGAFGFNGMELDTAVRHNLPIVVVLGNDAAWGVDKHYQMGYYGRAIATDLNASHYEMVAQGLGAWGECVERPEDLAPALERAFGCGRPALVNVMIQSAISPRAQFRLETTKVKL